MFELIAGSSALLPPVPHDPHGRRIRLIVNGRVAAHAGLHQAVEDVRAAGYRVEVYEPGTWVTLLFSNMGDSLP